MNEQIKINTNSDLNRNNKIEESEKNKIRKRLGQFFDDSPETQERFFKSINIFIKNGILDAKTDSNLREYLKIKDKNEFIDKAIIVFEPFLKMKILDPVLVEKVSRESFLEQGNFIKLNEILSYGIDDDSAHIHLAPLKELLREFGKEKILYFIKEGLEKLAEVFRENENLKKVTATSPVVVNNPEYLTGFGFILNGLVNEEDKEKYWRGETRDVGEAEMSRDRLLEYLNN